MSEYLLRTDGRQRRADAQRNRDAIVAAARTALAASGDTTMQAIAVAAGVGQGTLYRHFATREALLVEVYRSSFDSLMQSARHLAASEPGARALRLWLDELAEFGRAKHTLARVLDSASRDELHDEQFAPIHDAIDQVLQAGKEDGTVRRDVLAEDVLPLAGFLWHLDAPPKERVARLLDLVVDGLRPPRSGS